MQWRNNGYSGHKVLDINLPAKEETSKMTKIGFMDVLKEDMQWVSVIEEDARGRMR